MDVLSVNFRLQDHLEAAFNAAYDRERMGIGDADGLSAEMEAELPECCTYYDLRPFDNDPPSIVKQGPAYLPGPLGIHPGVISFAGPEDVPSLESAGPSGSSSSPHVPVPPHNETSQSRPVSPATSSTTPRMPTSPAPTAAFPTMEPAPASTDTPADGPPTKKHKSAGRIAREKKYSTKRRAENRTFDKKFFLPTTDERVFDAHPFSDADIVETDLSREDVSRTTNTGGWESKHMDRSEIDPNLHTLQDYLDAGYRLVEWDG